MSADGRYVAFLSDADNLLPGPPAPGFQVQIYVRDRQAARTFRVSTAPNGVPLAVAVNGRVVLLNSDATDLVSGDTNQQQDGFVRVR